MKLKKLMLVLGITLASSMMLVGCGGDNSDKSNEAKVEESGDKATADNVDSKAEKEADATTQDLPVSIGPNPETIDPALNSSVDGGNMILHAFEPLLIFDKNNNIKPGQAESYSISADGKKYKFTLREGLKWSDGSPLTAADFEYSIKRVADPKTAAPYAYDLLNVVKGWDEVQKSKDTSKLGVKAIDDRNLEIELSAPCPYFDKICAFQVLSPVNKKAVESDPSNPDKWATQADTYISNGPFRMKEWVPSSYILFEKNPNYRDADKIKLNTLKFVLMEDQNASYTAYNNGEILIAKDFPNEEIPTLKENADFHVDPIMGTAYVIFNTKKKPFDNADVRKALSLVVDRNYIANTIMYGINSPATSLVSHGISDFKPGSQFVDVTKELYGDVFMNDDNEKAVKEAKELLKKAGYPDGKGFPEFEYMTNEAGFNKPVAEYLQSVWKDKLGINMSIKIVEWGSFTPTRRAGDFEVARGGWVCDWNDPSNILNLVDTHNGNNDGKYSNPKVDKILKEANTTKDIEKHFKLCHEAEKIAIFDDMAVMPLVFQNDNYLQNQNVDGTWHSPYGFWYMMYGSIK